MPSLLKCVRNLLRRSSWEKYNRVGHQNPLDFEDRYIKVQLLQTGADGEVYLGLDTLTNSSVAIKRLFRAVDSTAAEVVISNTVGRACSRCLPTYDCYEDEGAVHIVSPFMENGDLFEYIFEKNNGEPVSATEGLKQLSIDAAMIHWVQMLLGVSEMHKLGIVHGDIKLDNMLVDARGRVKVGDFGRARKYSTEVEDRFQSGTLMYSAPETLTQTPVFGPEIDVWSLGVCLYVMLSGHFPFGGNTNDLTAKAICFSKPHEMHGRVLPVPLGQLFDQMFSKYADERITIDELLEHPIVSPYVKTVQKPSFSK